MVNILCYAMLFVVHKVNHVRRTYGALSKEHLYAEETKRKREDASFGG